MRGLAAGLAADKTYSVQFRRGSFTVAFREKEKLSKTRAYLQRDYIQTDAGLCCEFNKDRLVLFVSSKPHNHLISGLINVLRPYKLIHYNFVSTKLLLVNSPGTLNPIKYAHRFSIAWEKKKWLNRVSNLLTPNDNPEALKELKYRYPDINVFLFETGLDFDFWKPVMSREQARTKLDIPQGSFVIVLSQRLVPEYQVDKFIKVMAQIKSDQKIFCYITGHGLKDYEQYLVRLVDECGLQDRIRFIGYVPEEIIRLYLLAADLFAHLPVISAGSGAAVKAMALGVPILHVDSGSTCEFLKENSAGVIVKSIDYRQWVEVLTRIIEGKMIITPSREEVINFFNWAKTAREIDNAIQNSV